MRLPEIAVRRSISMIMVFIAFIGFGIFSLSQLGLDLFPKLEFPQIVIVSMMRGTGPEEMERLVTDVLEESVSQVMNLKNIESTSGSGSSVIFAEFEWGTDMNQAEIDIRNALDLYEDELPEDVSDPMVIALDPSLSPIMFLSFSSDVLNEAELRYLIENDIEPLINRIDGVGSTMTRGGIEEQINVDVNPIILSEQGLSLSQLVGALSSVREDVPAGDFSFNGTYMNMKVETAFHDLEEIGRLVVGQNAGMPVQLQNVASIYRGYKDIKSIVRVDGSSSVVMVVFRRADANTVNVCGRVIDSLSEIDDSFGSAFSSSIVFSQADFINKSIMNLADTGLIALVVASLVLLFFLRSWRTSLVVAISIPVSVILCFIALRLFDVTLNLISLSGLVLSVGMLVDNSIVVLENIFRHREMGQSPQQASIAATEEVGMAITASTLTTIVVFLPILFVPGITGMMFRDMSLTISFTIIMSLFVALTLVPLLASKTKNLVSSHKKGSIAHKHSLKMDGVLEKYKALLQKALTRKKSVILGTVVLLVISLLVMQGIPREFMEQPDMGFISLNAERTFGTDLESTDSTANVIEMQLRELLGDDLQSMYVKIGQEGGMEAVMGAVGPNQMAFMMRLCDVSDREMSVPEYKDEIRNMLDEMPDIQYDMEKSSQMMMGSSNAVEITLYGDDLEELRSVAEQIGVELSSIPGTKEVTTSIDAHSTELSFVPGYVQLAMRGLSPAFVSGELSTAFQGAPATFYREIDDEFDVVVRLAPEFRDSQEDFRAFTIAGMPLDGLGTFVERIASPEIARRNQSRVASIFCAVSGRSLGDVAKDVDVMMDTLDTRGMRFEVGGQTEDMKETLLFLGLAVIVAALLVYMVMAGQFESLLEPFIIILTIPMALIGVIWTLFITGTTISVTSLIGIVLLAGIVVNNGIVLIDYANRLRADGMDIVNAIVTSGVTRFRPILMTALTTILALAPLALGLGEGSEMWAPMAISVMGGLTVATALTLFLVPCLYVVLGSHKRFAKYARKFKTDDKN